MKKVSGIKKIICAAIAAAVISTVPSAGAFAAEVSATPSVGNGLILSTDTITLLENDTATFTAALGDGFDASRLSCVVADTSVATVTPTAYAANVAGFEVSYAGLGSTVAAVYHVDNPAVVAYVTINSSSVVMNIPSKLGTNKKNYCTLVSYEFVPYDFTYADFNDYKSTLKLEYKCAAYGDEDYRKWGCYGYFFDAEGNVLSKVHLYGTLSVGRVYTSEFNVPVNAVSFTIEGF
ncbi:MAG: hypothetical protein LUE96_03120 [Lachnospiraceae bacterium]|nr:hypothetical protein [Lachnospiraceae bacterium]